MSRASAAVDEARGLFVAVAICAYDDENYARLDGARRAMDRLVRIMRQAGFEIVELEDATYDDVAARLDGSTWKDRGFLGPLLVAWTGHGRRLDDELGLVVTDTPPKGGIGKTHRPKDLARFARATGSTDSLILLDTCSSGAGDAEIVEAAVRADNESSQAGRPPRLGVVVSCKAYQPAVDGAFLGSLADLLENGPAPDEVGVFAPLWSSSYESVPLAAVTYVLEQKTIGDQSPRSWLSGGSNISFPNPAFAPSQPAGLVSERLERALGVERADDLVVTPAIDELQERLEAGHPGLWIIIGAGGCGKSTCLTESARGARTATVVSASEGLDAVQGVFRSASGPVLVDGLDLAPLRELEGVVGSVIREAKQRFVVLATRPEALEVLRPGPAGRDLMGTERVLELDKADWMREAIVHYVVQRLEAG